MKWNGKLVPKGIALLVMLLFVVATAACNASVNLDLTGPTPAAPRTTGANTTLLNQNAGDEGCPKSVYIDLLADLKVGEVVVVTKPDGSVVKQTCVADHYLLSQQVSPANYCPGNCTAPSPTPCVARPGFTCGTPPAIIVPSAQTDGMTDCKALESVVIAKDPDPTTVGSTEKHPIVYPDNWVHDSCFAWASYGTGGKFVQAPTTRASIWQRGEETGKANLVIVPLGKGWSGWAVAGWGYVSDEARDAQVGIENLAQMRLGHVCGYQRQVKLTVDVYRWDGTDLKIDSTLACKFSVEQMLDPKFPGNQLGTSNNVDPNAKTGPQPTPAPAYSNKPQPTVAPVKEQDWKLYPFIFKVKVQDANVIRYFCGIQQRDVKAMPANVLKVIEYYDKHDYDGDYAHDGGRNGMSRNGYCSGGAENGQEWELKILTPAGFQDTKFPLN